MDALVRAFASDDNVVVVAVDEGDVVDDGEGGAGDGDGDATMATATPATRLKATRGTQ